MVSEDSESLLFFLSATGNRGSYEKGGYRPLLTLLSIMPRLEFARSNQMV